MRKFIFMFIAVLSLLVLIGCPEPPADSSVTYAIGGIGPSGVGIVFYITDGGLHGLEVAPVDQSTFAAWSNIWTPLIGTGTAIGTGSANTAAIIGQSGHTASAAQICRNYRIVEEGDWFLPSQDELDAIWDNLVDDGFGNNNGVGGFASEGYWSSSEDSLGIAWYQTFNVGAQFINSKLNNYRVRAVRAF